MKNLIKTKSERKELDRLLREIDTELEKKDCKDCPKKKGILTEFVHAMGIVSTPSFGVTGLQPTGEIKRRFAGSDFNPGTTSDKEDPMAIKDMMVAVCNEVEQIKEHWSKFTKYGNLVSLNRVKSGLKEISEKSKRLVESLNVFSSKIV